MSTRPTGGARRGELCRTPMERQGLGRQIAWNMVCGTLAGIGALGLYWLFFKALSPLAGPNQQPFDWGLTSAIIVVLAAVAAVLHVGYHYMFGQQPKES